MKYFKLGIALAGMAFVSIAWAQEKGAPDNHVGDGFGPPERGSAADTFGHRIFDNASGQCGFSIVDISGTGTPLTYTASGGFPAADDGGAAVTLAAPMTFYGTTVNNIVVSANGYIAMGTPNGLADEDGGDFSEDCPLPATPANAVATASRIHPFHNDLAGDGSGGTTYVEYFAVCPRASEAGVEDCTIVFWDDWGTFAGGADSYDMQAVLYHQSGLIAYQYDDPLGLLDPTTAAIGMQNAVPDDAAVYACQASVPVNGNSVCTFDPSCEGPGCLAPAEPAIPVPTSSRYGLLLLMLMLALGGTWFLRRD